MLYVFSKLIMNYKNNTVYEIQSYTTWIHPQDISLQKLKYSQNTNIVTMHY